VKCGVAVTPLLAVHHPGVVSQVLQGYALVDIDGEAPFYAVLDLWAEPAALLTVR